MKILLIGFLVLSGWSALSTYIYVCKIKGLCDEPNAIEIPAVTIKAIPAADTLTKALVVEQAALPENMVVYFAFDKSDFNSDAKTDRYLDESRLYLDKNLQARLSITGHTDAVGSDEYNQALGYRRAKSMQNYFESKGMPAIKILIESMGEKEPAENNNTNDGRAGNRRAIITIKK
jgi:outer membrane protein OmpA-like peptidoglycan-associated protein